MIEIEIKLRPRNKIKDFILNVQDKSEDIIFSIITKIPEQFVPSSVIQRLSKYIDKRTHKLQQGIIRQRWEEEYLKQVISKMRDKQQGTNKAPQED